MGHVDTVYIYIYICTKNSLSNYPWQKLVDLTHRVSHRFSKASFEREMREIRESGVLQK